MPLSILCHNCKTMSVGFESWDCYISGQASHIDDHHALERQTTATSLRCLLNIIKCLLGFPMQYTKCNDTEIKELSCDSQGEGA